MKRLLLLVLIAAPVACFSQGFQVNLEGEQQIGMGHTGTGTALDGAAIFFNPGAVVQLPENYIQAGVSPLFFQSEFNPANTFSTFRTENKLATPFTFYGAFGPKNSWWKFGLGVYTPFGGLTDWGNTWPGRYYLESLDLKTIFIQPTLSIKLADFVSIGGGFVYNRSTIDLTQALPLQNQEGQDGQAHLNGNGHGYGWNAGVYFKTESGMTIGISHRSGVPTDFSGSADFVVASALQSEFPSPNTFKSTVSLPGTTSFGIGIYPSSQWILAADINIVGWNVFKALSFTYGQQSTEINTTTLPQNYGDAGTFRLGAQYKPTGRLALRVGGGFAGAAAGPDYVTPQVPDANRYYFTGGIGYKITERLNVDASFEYEHLIPRPSDLYGNFPGTYDTNVYIPGIALAYHW
jgi:long-chain fatty acid transport protein